MWTGYSPSLSTTTKTSGMTLRWPLALMLALQKWNAAADGRAAEMNEQQRNMLADLGAMHRRAHNESLGKGISPKAGMIRLLESDLRFRDFDLSALADAADSWFRSGPKPDLDDPALRGQPGWQKRI